MNEPEEGRLQRQQQQPEEFEHPQQQQQQQQDDVADTANVMLSGMDPVLVHRSQQADTLEGVVGSVECQIMNAPEKGGQQQQQQPDEFEHQQQQQKEEDKVGDTAAVGLSFMDPVFVHRSGQQADMLEGVVGYVGSVDFSNPGDNDNDWVGVRLTGSSVGLGKNSGTVLGRFYFDAPYNCGLFVRRAAVERRSLTKRQELQLRRDLGVTTATTSNSPTDKSRTGMMAPSSSSSNHGSSPPSRIISSGSSGNTTPATTSPRKQLSLERNVSPDSFGISKQIMARTPFINSSSSSSSHMGTNEEQHDEPAQTRTPNKAAADDAINKKIAAEANISNPNDSVIASGTLQTMARTPPPPSLNERATTGGAPFPSLPDTATKKEVQEWIQGLATAPVKLTDTAIKKKEVQAWIQDLATAPPPQQQQQQLPATTTTPITKSDVKAWIQGLAGAGDDDDDDDDNHSNIMVLPDMAAEDKPVRLWDNNEISPAKSVKNVIDIQQQQQLPSSPSLSLPLPEPSPPSNHEESLSLAVASPRGPTHSPRRETGQRDVLLLQHQQQQRATTPRNGEINSPNDTMTTVASQQQQQRDGEQEQQPDYSYTAATQERFAFNATTGEAPQPSPTAFTSARQQQPQVRTRRVAEIVLQMHDKISEITKCQAWTTLLLAWITIFPIFGLASILLWKPSLIFRYHHADQDNNEESYVTMLSGGLLLGQTLSHMVLLLPLTGDCFRACCCCRRRTPSHEGINTFSVNASRLAAVGTAWTGLVVLLSTVLVIEHAANADDDVDDTPFFILLSASGTTLVLSCLSLMISFLPCSSKTTRVSDATSRGEGLLEPLLAPISDNDAIATADRDEEAPPRPIILDDTDAGDEPGEVAPTSRLKGTRRLLQLASSQVFYLYSGCVVLLIRLPFSISIPHFVSTAISALAQGEFERARHQVFYLLVLGSIDSVLDFWTFFLFGFANLRIVRDLRLDLFWRLLNMEVGFFDVNNTGALSSRLNNDCSAMAGDLTWFFRFSIESVVRITGITAYMLIRSPRLGACALSIIPIVAAVNKWYGSWLSKNASAVQEALAQANTVAQEALIHIRTVIAFAAEDDEQRRYDEKIGDQYQLNVKQLFMQSVYYMAISTFLINTVVQSALLWIGAYMIERQQLTAEVLLAFMLYQGQLQSETLNLFQSYTSLIQSSGAGEKVFALLDRTPPPPAMGSSAVNASRQREDDEADTSAVAVQQQSSHTLQLQQVSFRYPSRPQKTVLNQFDLVINRGQTVALCGPSGVGKSTIIHLLQRFYDPSAGAVLVDGIDLRRLDLQLHRRSIGVVTQDCVLFDGTILDNLMFGSSGRGQVSAAERQEAIRAAELAHADIFVREFALGYDTPVGEGGVQLSGGQKQRIAIARAIYKKPSLLLLDEATSNLDSQSEQIVQRALDELLQRTGDNMTTVVIAHRLKTVQNADLIAVLGPTEGRIVECGTHQELLQKRNGIYRTMVERASTTGILPENV